MIEQITSDVWVWVAREGEYREDIPGPPPPPPPPPTLPLHVFLVRFRIAALKILLVLFVF